MASDINISQWKKFKALHQLLIDFREDWDALRWEFGLIPTPETKQYFNDKAEVRILILSDQIEDLLASQEHEYASKIATFSHLKAKLERMIQDATIIKQELEGNQDYVYKYTNTSKWKVIALPQNQIEGEEIPEGDEEDGVGAVGLDTIMEEGDEETALREPTPVHADALQLAFLSQTISRHVVAPQESDARQAIQKIRNNQHVLQKEAANTTSLEKRAKEVRQEGKPRRNPQGAAQREPVVAMGHNGAVAVDRRRTSGFGARGPLASMRNGILSIQYRNMSGIRHDTRALTKIFGEDQSLRLLPVATESSVFAAGTSTVNTARAAHRGVATSENSSSTLSDTTIAVHSPPNRNGNTVGPQERLRRDIYDPSEQDDFEQEERRNNILQKKKPKLHKIISIYPLSLLHADVLT